MDLSLYQKQLADPRHNQADLMRMRENALSKNAIEHIHAAEMALTQRYPNWRNVKSRRAGAKAIDVEFLGQKQHCDSEKDAYIWLIERFIQHYPKPFVVLDWETVFVAAGPRSLYFAKSLNRLFGESYERLAQKQHNWRRLSNGWYAKLVLNEKQKLGLLNKFSAVAQLRFGVDWDWNCEGRENPQKSPMELLQELHSL